MALALDNTITIIIANELAICALGAFTNSIIGRSPIEMYVAVVIAFYQPTDSLSVEWWIPAGRYRNQMVKQQRRNAGCIGWGSHTHDGGEWDEQELFGSIRVISFKSH